MGNMAEETAWSNEETCECGCPLDKDGNCTNTARCLAQMEREGEFEE